MTNRLLLLFCVLQYQVLVVHLARKGEVATTEFIKPKIKKTREPDHAALQVLDYDVWCKLQPNGNDCNEKGNEQTRYYYDTKMEGCKTFGYKGCTEAYNNFDTLQECNEACRESGLHQVVGNYSYKIFCRMQPEFGECQDYHPSFYFDINTRNCKGFSYSGCGGNHNRFPDHKTCIAVCLRLMESELNIIL